MIKIRPYQLVPFIYELKYLIKLVHFKSIMYKTSTFLLNKFPHSRCQLIYTLHLYMGKLKKIKAIIFLLQSLFHYFSLNHIFSYRLSSQITDSSHFCCPISGYCDLYYHFLKKAHSPLWKRT